MPLIHPDRVHRPVSIRLTPSLGPDGRYMTMTVTDRLSGYELLEAELRGEELLTLLGSGAARVLAEMPRDLGPRIGRKMELESYHLGRTDPAGNAWTDATAEAEARRRSEIAVWDTASVETRRGETSVTLRRWVDVPDDHEETDV